MTNMFAVLDSAAERYLDPFPGSTMAVAIRGFEEACQTEGHQFQKFPEDYSLWHVAEFDPELGEMQGMKARKIAMATSFVHGAQLDIQSEEQA